MAEAHQFLAAVLVLRRRDEFRAVVAFLMNLREHFQHRLVRAAVQRPPQRAHPRRATGEKIRLARRHHAHRRGRAILLRDRVAAKNIKSSAFTTSGLISTSSYGIENSMWMKFAVYCTVRETISQVRTIAAYSYRNAIGPLDYSEQTTNTRRTSSTCCSRCRMRMLKIKPEVVKRWI